ncbi:MAG TPA: TorF family putative porin [Steroidobacteraceae bacterium]|nr:TorF family putative porin [Steroidobacteraceae bacterium]
MVFAVYVHNVSRSRLRKPPATTLWLSGCLLALWWAGPARCQSGAPVLGGNVAVTSDYIYRGVSESDGHGALQADLHAATGAGTFAGVWASTRDRRLVPGSAGELQLYLGQRFALSSAWSATLSARADSFVGDAAAGADDYQELDLAFAWLDRWTLSLGAIPNAVRYLTYQAYGSAEYYRFGRSPAYVADSAVQWLLVRDLFATGGVGFYYTSGRGPGPGAATGYAYGNAGLAWQLRRWRLDVGYFAAQRRAARLFPYPVANHLAATVSWQF